MVVVVVKTFMRWVLLSSETGFRVCGWWRRFNKTVYASTYKLLRSYTSLNPETF